MYVYEAVFLQRYPFGNIVQNFYRENYPTLTEATRRNMDNSTIYPVPFGVANTTSDTWNASRLVNSTTLVPSWTYVPVFLVITSVFGVLGNGVLVVVFLSERYFRHTFSDFNVYIVNLLVANILCILINYPMQVVTTIYSSAWFMGYPACTLLIYGWDILEGICMNSHALIAIVRVWAIVHPFSYRNHHSTRFALAACFAVWIWIHLFLVPGIVLDAKYYREPVEIYGCLLNSAAQQEWSIANLFLIYFLPWIVILLALPAVVFAHVLRQWRIYFLRLPRVIPDNHTHLNIPATVVENSNGVEKALHKRPVHKYTMLIALTISVTVCWSPSLIYFFIVDFGGKLWIPDFYEVARVLFSFQPMLDPLMFALSFSWIQKVFYRSTRSQHETRHVRERL